MNTLFRNMKVNPKTAKRWGLLPMESGTGNEVKGEAKDCCFPFKQRWPYFLVCPDQSQFMARKVLIWAHYPGTIINSTWAVS